MRIFKKILQEFISFKKVIVTQDNNNGNANMNDNEIANTINKTHNYNFIVDDQKQIKELYETVITKDTSVALREAIVPIETLINAGKFQLAINKYEELIASNTLSKYSSDEKFLIYNGLLNCHINNKASNETIDIWVNKIQALGTEIKEIHRFYCLLGIREYNNKNFVKALVLLKQSVQAKSNYMNAVTAKLLVEVTQKNISFEDAEVILNALIKENDSNLKDLATLHSGYGDIAFNSKNYSLAKEQYTKSNELIDSLSKRIAIANCHYFLSFREIKEDGRVDLDKIDFDMLKQAELLFDDIYSNRTSDTEKTIVNMAITFYFNILSLNSNFNKIIEIYNSLEECFDKEDSDVLQYVAEAEVINGILDTDKLNVLCEYEQVRLEAIYYEKRAEYEKVLEIIIPVIEGVYKNDKMLQLTLLNSLKELNDFDRYMHYYSKFSSHQEEVMKMNYIQFLVKRDQREIAIKEIDKMKDSVKNGFVIYDLLLIYLEYELSDKLDEFFAKVDDGTYNIIGTQKPFILYQKIMHSLNQKRFDEYFRLYDTSDLSILSDNYRIILEINYYMFKGDYENLASAYFKYFEVTGNHNELLKAVQFKLQINRYYEAEYYLNQINPMELVKPEFYYMFKAVILNEKHQLNDAFDELSEALRILDIDLNSPFHQFYVAFNMNNNRIDKAVMYMNEYYSKNPEPYFFKFIQHSEDETGEELLKKLEEELGGKRDLTLINNYFSKGVLGLSAYSHLTGTNIEEIVYSMHYPYTRVPISRENILETKSKIDTIGNKIIIDANTLIVLSIIDSLHLLDIFDELLIPITSIEVLTQRKASMFKINASKVLEYISRTPTFKPVPIDEGMKIKNEARNVLTREILDCISLSQQLDIPFLNTEVAVNIEYHSNLIIDVNALLFYMKEYHSDKRPTISQAVQKLRNFGFEFISFDTEDIYSMYLQGGQDNIKPFLKMGVDADYNTFIPTYTNFLMNIYKNHSIEEFESCSSEIIQFIDRYVGKMRYYISTIMRNYPEVANNFELLLQNPSIKNVLMRKSLFSITPHNAEVFSEIMNTFEFNKITSIASAFVAFVIQYLSIFNNAAAKTKYTQFLIDHLKVNDTEDISYILYFNEKYQNDFR
ncbi:hypothetical protein YDYSY3_45220 [Paenibacillus chitinolyticus]|uniref:tetratricopeptide repeat protein n=1 Tax=Paenibacillus chitinolyticus TaxID=79263 RepID=UPI0026E4B615|nr:hypothetical protein [Paenibacillus chitinolyticus]GKS13522.1 hypothetical protein YDYSY3_45220 [Paenibacillus chitinolyticus]